MPNKIKKLIEQRDAKLTEAGALTDAIEKGEEIRAFTKDENEQFSAIMAEVESLNATIDAEKRMAGLDTGSSAIADDANKEKEAEEIRAFANYFRSPNSEESRANFAKGDNGAVISDTIANIIITKVTNICPIFAKATIYHVKGKLIIPYYPSGDGNVTVAYADDFEELTASAGQFGKIELDGYLMGALALVGRKLINSSDIDIVNFVTNEIARRIAIALEKEFLIGTKNKCTGAVSTANVYTAPAATAITVDDLVKLQSRVNQAFQTEACWTMNTKTFTDISLLKDGNDRYLIQNDITLSFPYRLFGKPVYISDNMPDIGAGATPILYGDYSGLAVNLHEDISMQVLYEKYATQHAVGIVAWIEVDSKVQDSQRLAVMKMATT